MNSNNSKWFFITLFLSIWYLLIPGTQLKGDNNGQAVTYQFQKTCPSDPSLLLERITIDRYGLTADFIYTNRKAPIAFFIWKYGNKEAYYIKGLDKKVNLKLMGCKNIEFDKRYVLSQGATISYSLVFALPPEDMKHFSILEGTKDSKVKIPGNFPDIKLSDQEKTEHTSTALTDNTGSIPSPTNQKTLTMNILLGKEMPTLKLNGFTPDGNYMVTSCPSTKEIVYWDTFTGAMARTVKGIIDEGEIAAFSNDLKYTLTANKEKGIKLWETFSGKELRQFDSPPRTVKELLFSPDNLTFLTIDDIGSAHIDDIHTGKILFQLIDHSDSSKYEVALLARFSKDGRYIAVTISPGLNRDNIVRIWDLTSGKGINPCSFSGEGKVDTLGFSPDNKHIFIGGYTMNGYRQEARFFFHNLATKQTINFFRGGTYSIDTFSFHPDNLHCLVPNYNTINLWNVNVPGEQFVAQVEEDGIEAVNFHPSGHYFITGAFNGTLRLWDLYGKKQLYTNNNNIYSGEGKRYFRVEKVLFNQSGDRFAVQYGSGEVHLYAFIEGDMATQFETAAGSKEGTPNPIEKLLHLYAAKKLSEGDESRRDIYAQIKKENTLSAYETVLAKFPNTPQAIDAKLQILALQQKKYEEYKKTNTIEDYNMFVALYPDYPQVADAISNIGTLSMQGESTPEQLKIIGDLREKSLIIKDFLLVTRLQNKKASVKYLDKYKNNKEAACYVDYIIKDELERIDTIKEAEVFIQQYPHSFFIPRLEKWLITKREELTTQKKQEQESIERSAYRNVMATGSLEAARDFITGYPESVYLPEVKRMTVEKMTAIQQQELASVEATAKQENYLAFIEKFKTKDSPLKDSEYVQKAELWLIDYFNRMRNRLKTGADIILYNDALTKYGQLSYAEGILADYNIIADKAYEEASFYEEEKEYVKFIATYPFSRFTYTAYEKIYLTYSQKEDIGAYEVFLAKYPKSPFYARGKKIVDAHYEKIRLTKLAVAQRQAEEQKRKEAFLNYKGSLKVGSRVSWLKEFSWRDSTGGDLVNALTGGGFKHEFSVRFIGVILNVLDLDVVVQVQSGMIPNRRRSILGSEQKYYDKAINDNIGATFTIPINSLDSD